MKRSVLDVKRGGCVIREKVDKIGVELEEKIDEEERVGGKEKVYYCWVGYVEVRDERMGLEGLKDKGE